jgi:phosphate transport system protein
MKDLLEQLDLLREELLHMARTAERMLHDSIKALVLQDSSITSGLLDMEKEVNRLQLQIDERAATILALQQPVAHDLRFIVSAMKVANDIERIADQAVNIQQNVSILSHLPEQTPIPDLRRMADITQAMVREAIRALEEENAGLARRIVLLDDEVDALKNLIFRELMSFMMSDPHRVQDSLQVILASRHLERIADHATNIAEDVVYMAEALDIRHHAESASKSLE